MPKTHANCRQFVALGCLLVGVASAHCSTAHPSGEGLSTSANEAARPVLIQTFSNSAIPSVQLGVNPDAAYLLVAYRDTYSVERFEPFPRDPSGIPSWFRRTVTASLYSDEAPRLSVPKHYSVRGSGADDVFITGIDRIVRVAALGAPIVEVEASRFFFFSGFRPDRDVRLGFSDYGMYFVAGNGFGPKLFSTDYPKSPANQRGRRREVLVFKALAASVGAQCATIGRIELAPSSPAPQTLSFSCTTKERATVHFLARVRADSVDVYGEKQIGAPGPYTNLRSEWHGDYFYSGTSNTVYRWPASKAVAAPLLKASPADGLIADTGVFDVDSRYVCFTSDLGRSIRCRGAGDSENVVETVFTANEGSVVEQLALSSKASRSAQRFLYWVVRSETDRELMGMDLDAPRDVGCSCALPTKSFDAFMNDEYPDDFNWLDPHRQLRQSFDEALASMGVVDHSAAAETLAPVVDASCEEGFRDVDTLSRGEGPFRFEQLQAICSEEPFRNLFGSESLMGNLYKAIGGRIRAAAADWVDPQSSQMDDLVQVAREHCGFVHDRGSARVFFSLADLESDLNGGDNRLSGAAVQLINGFMTCSPAMPEPSSSSDGRAPDACE